MDIKKQNLLDEELSYASSTGKLEYVKKVIDAGASVHSKNDNALKWALRSNHLEVVKYLILEHDCNIQTMLNSVEIYVHNEVFKWCEQYMKSKKLNDSLELDLKNDKNAVSKKVKV